MRKYNNLLREKRLLESLEQLGISCRVYRHEAVSTVEEAKKLHGRGPGGHSKNLVLCGRKGGLFLLTTQEDQKLRLNDLARQWNLGRFSFAKAEILREKLDVEPGAVSPFGAGPTVAEAISFLLDRSLLDYETINFHPLHNQATLALAPDDFLKLMASWGHKPALVAIP